MPLSDRIDLDQVPPSFRPFAEAILRRDDPAPGLIRLLGTLGENTGTELFFGLDPPSDG